MTTEMMSMTPEQFNKTLDYINERINDDDKELFVAIVALVISVVALLASLLQVAQQYYASAFGFSNCGEKSIGKWAKSTRRQLKPSEFRFEVHFETPVIFLCPPKNTRGPVKDQPIFHIDGSPESLKNTGVELRTPEQAKKNEGAKSEREIKEAVKQRVHTADNELASWVTLLTSLQQMEQDSRAWQRKKYEEKVKLQEPPRDNGRIEQEDVDPILKEVTGSYTLTVAVQKKLRSWDTMPANVKKPYATTTWCHIVEMLALLGVNWVEFNRTNEKYRGEGNGFTVTGEKASDLGIMFTFQVHGGNRFESNRVIPVDEVKELCFGFVPTIYRSKSDERRLNVPNDETRDLSTMNFASKHEIAETLVLIGCNTNTVNYFSEKSTARVTHVFPMAFEIMGMLARTLHIEKSAFRRLPNPTLYRWDTRNFSLPRLFLAYELQFRKLHVGKSPSNVIKVIARHIEELRDPIEQLVPMAESSNSLSLTVTDALHKALDTMDEVLTFKKNQRPGIKKTYTTTSSLNARVFSSKLGQLEPGESVLETRRRELVQAVLRSHIQEVLSGFNTKAEEVVVDVEGANTLASSPSKFAAIDAETPEKKQDKLMEAYFKVVLRKIQKMVLKRQPNAPSGFALRSARRTGLSTRTAMTVEDSDADSDDEMGAPKELKDLDPIDDDGEKIDVLDMNLEVTSEDIWCTLVFRMICWLMLHDFHKRDFQQASKSELFGSRLPVYIA
ncbi:hypothetical protein C8035_v005744 [Colletotrichum spinosum]|uniref:Modin n=1 Tax=Colletotrichum spinosum TaxID=1347390 RepID=A0A4R8QJH1_9PEZI|nr:hypothetical protein C8035_v005744 [Colletotrichum spinosum]